MFLLQLVRQRHAFVKIRRQLDRTPQRIRNRRASRAAVLPITRHHPELLRDHFRQGCVASLGLLLCELEKFGIQLDRQRRAHGGKLPWIHPDDKRERPFRARSMGDAGERTSLLDFFGNAHKGRKR